VILNFTKFSNPCQKNKKLYPKIAKSSARAGCLYEWLGYGAYPYAGVGERNGRASGHSRGAECATVRQPANASVSPKKATKKYYQISQKFS